MTQMTQMKKISADLRYLRYLRLITMTTPMRRIFPILFLVAGLLAGCSDRMRVSGEYLERSVNIGGKEYRYRVFIPPGRDPNAKLPVMLYLHGSGVRGEDNVQQADAFSQMMAPVRNRINFIVVLPQCRENTFWAAKDMADYALAALDRSVEELNGDPQRIYLSGFSLGGRGTWQIAAANPKKFAALVPVAGGVVAEHPIEPRDRAAIIPSVGEMLDSPEPYQAIANAIGQTPVWVFHGAKDDAVPVDYARTIVKALDDAGNKNVKYTEYADDGHIIVIKAFEEPGLFEWLAEQSLLEQQPSSSAVTSPSRR